MNDNLAAIGAVVLIIAGMLAMMIFYNGLQYISWRILSWIF